MGSMFAIFLLLVAVAFGQSPASESSQHIEEHVIQFAIPYPESASSLDEIRKCGQLPFVSVDQNWCVLIWYSPTEGIGYGDAVVYRRKGDNWTIHKAAKHILKPAIQIAGNNLIITRLPDLNTIQREHVFSIPMGSASANRAIQVLFEGLAKDMPFAAWEDFLYDREPSHLGTELVEYDRQMNTLKCLSLHPCSDILPLLKHPNPKVRTLAMAALFHKEDPAMLPHIHGLADDSATAIPDASPISVIVLRPDIKAYDIKQITVGWLAKLLLRFWLEPAGYDESTFEDYWRERKGRKICASWFIVRYTRATGGISSVPKERYERVRALRPQFEPLPEPDRSLTLLVLSGTDVERILATEQEYLTACRTLGRPKLLNILKGNTGSDDPDLQSKPRKAIVGWEAICAFILDHTKALLEPQDAEGLLALAKNHKSRRWAIAASRLQHRQQREILKRAIQEFSEYYEDYDRAVLAGELWRAAGEEETTYLKDLFFSMQRAYTNGYSFRGHLVRYIHDDSPPASAKRFIRTILSDQRSENILWFDFMQIVEVCNQLSAEAIVTADELNNLNFLLKCSDWSNDRGFQKAKLAYPEEYKEVKKTLTAWRKRLLDFAQSKGW